MNLAVARRSWACAPPIIGAIVFFAVLAGRVDCQCPMTGCTDCSVVGGNAACSKCSGGYYKSLTKDVCYQCQARCLTCTYYDTCQSCKGGYFYDSSQSFCISCPEKCTECSSVTTCTACEDGNSLNNSLCAAKTEEAGGSSKSSSLVGQIIGYCVSGVLLVVCCVITLLHQKRKQEEEEEARRKFKEEQTKNERRPEHRSQHGEVIEDPEFDRIHNNPAPIQTLQASGLSLQTKPNGTKNDLGSSTKFLLHGQEPSKLDPSYLNPEMFPNQTNGNKMSRKDKELFNATPNSNFVLSPKVPTSVNGTSSASVGVFTRMKNRPNAKDINSRPE